MNKIEQEFYKAFDIEEIYPPISERAMNRLEQICGKAVWYLGDCLIFKMDKKTNKSLIFRYKYFAEEYSDRLIAEGHSKKEALLKLASNEYLRTVIYNDVRRLLGIKKSRK